MRRLLFENSGEMKKSTIGCVHPIAVDITEVFNDAAKISLLCRQILIYAC